MIKDDVFSTMRVGSQKAIAWLGQEKHRVMARRAQAEFKKAFTQHPEDTGETYLEHLWFTFKISLRFAYVTLVILIHGLFPFWFVRTSSQQIEKVYGIMKSRIPKSRLAEIEREEDLQQRDVA